MPTYEYRCPDGHTFEVIQGFNDAPVAVCEVCGKPVQRVLHSPAVHFKGSGFYNTDYGTRNRQREQKASADGGGADAPATKTDAGETKPAAADKPAAEKPTSEKAAPSKRTG